MVQQITVSTNEFHQKDFLRVAVLNRSTKGAMTGSFRRAHFPWPSINKKRAKMKCLSNLEQVLMKFISKTFSSCCFKLLYERSKDQLLSQGTLFIDFCQQKVNKNEMVQQIAVNTNEFNKEEFRKVAFLNRTTKGAITGSFRRAHSPQPSINRK